MYSTRCVPRLSSARDREYAAHLPRRQGELLCEMRETIISGRLVGHRINRRGDSFVEFRTLIGIRADDDRRPPSANLPA